MFDYNIQKNNTIPGVPQELDTNYSDSSSETYTAKAVHVWHTNIG
jgi:hypothetical protein